MEGVTKDLAPWEVPPDESYWQALLNEGEYGEDTITPAEEEATTWNMEPNTAFPQTSEDQADAFQGSEENYGNWAIFGTYQKENKTVELPVVGFNRGGLLVKWDGTIGFVPASQLCDSLTHADESLRQDALSTKVGSTLILKPIEVDPEQSRLILSERAAHRLQESNLAILDKLSPGDVCQGRVTNLCAFGAFVDLGGVEGLIHISELSWGRVSHPTDVLHSGQQIDVYVLNVDPERERIGLSLKRLNPDPWETVESRYMSGQVVEGKITNIVNFGAFVRIEEGLEGLIHNSELSGDPFTSQPPLQTQDVVQVRIVSIDRTRHRMALSLEQVMSSDAQC